MGFYTKAEVYRKAAQFNEVDVEVNEINQEIAEEEARHAEAMRPRNMKIRAIEEVQDQIQQHGMSRPLAERLRDITGEEDLLEAHGVAMESFTMIPSRNGVQVALEVSENQKSFLLGAGALLAVGIVAKIIHWIYKFFKGRKETDNNRAEAEKNMKEKAKAFKDAYDLYVKTESDSKFKDIIKNADQYDRSIKMWTESYNSLLEDILFNKEGEKTKAVMSSLMAMQDYEAGGKITAEAASYVLREIDNPSPQFEEQARKWFKESYAKLPPASMRKNLEGIQQLVDDLASDNIQRIEIDSVKAVAIWEQAAKLGNDNTKFWSKLENFSPFKNEKGFFSGNYDEKITEFTAKMRAKVDSFEKDGGGLTKEFIVELKAFIDFFKENMQLLSRTVAFYVKVSAMWEKFCNMTSRALVGIEKNLNGSKTKK